jgi:uncharacterized membrane protein YfcA
MAPAEMILIACVGVIAGVANTVAGAGSLLTYPILIACGLPPLAANVTNDIGIVPGNLSGALGLRDVLRDQRPLLRTLVPRAALGALLGAIVVLLAPGGAFGWVAPPLLLLASLLTLAQPALIRRTQQGSGEQRGLHAAIDATSVYGGYFGTGIGLIYIATLGAFVNESATRLNAVKTVLQLTANGLAGVVFILVAPVHWPAAAALAVGTLGGGSLGARVSRHIPPALLRKLIASLGALAAVWLMSRQITG